MSTLIAMISMKTLAASLWHQFDQDERKRVYEMNEPDMSNLRWVSVFIHVSED
jgi:hypothetical protein